MRPSEIPNVSMVLVGDSAEGADHWIAEHVSAFDVCVTSDTPLHHAASQRAPWLLPLPGKHWTPANIGNALACREITQHLPELGTSTRAPAPLTKRHRSRFLSALDTVVQAALQHSARGSKHAWGEPLPCCSPKPELASVPYSAFSTKSLSAPDSAPQTSPLRPASCRTPASRSGSGKDSNFSVLGSKRMIAFAPQSLTQTASVSST